MKKHIQLNLTPSESERLREVLDFTIGSLFALPDERDQRKYRAKKGSLVKLINYGLRDVWRVRNKLEQEMR
jgi:hypothetical protein